MKNPLTPAGIEPATYRFVLQHLNLCATSVIGTVLFIIYDITTRETIVNSFVTISGCKKMAQKFFLMMANVTLKYVGQ